MTAQKKRPSHLRRVLVLLVLGLSALTILCVGNLNRVALSLSAARARAATSRLLNAAVNDLMNQGLTYHDLAALQQDAAGRVTSLQVNTPLMNALASEVTLSAQDALTALEEMQVSVPLGAALGGTLLAGTGPRVAIRVLPVGSVSAGFTTEFVSAGINQTRHRILLTVTATVRLVLPAGGGEIKVSAQTAVAETIIVGEVPDSFVDVTDEDRMLNLIP